MSEPTPSVLACLHLRLTPLRVQPLHSPSFLTPALLNTTSLYPSLKKDRLGGGAVTHPPKPQRLTAIKAHLLFTLHVAAGQLGSWLRVITVLPLGPG